MILKLLLVIWLITVAISAYMMHLGIRKIINRYGDLELSPAATAILALSLVECFFPVVNLMWAAQFYKDPFKYLGDDS